MVGLRGVGKTVLLDRMRDDAEANGIQTLRVEAPESRSLPAILAPQLRQALLRLSRNEQAKELAIRALRALAGFAKALKVKYADIEVGLDFDPEPGLADNGDLEHDLQALIEVVGAAAQKAGTALALFVDELQYVEEEELAALITALHRAAQRQLPVVLIGAGLPQLRGRMGRAKSYAERLFDFPLIDRLDPDAARQALAKQTPAPPTQLDIYICSAMSGESKRITQSVQIKSTIFNLRYEINAAFAKPPGTPIQIFLGQRLLPVGSFRFFELLFDYRRSAKCSCTFSGCPAHKSEG